MGLRADIFGSFGERKTGLTRAIQRPADEEKTAALKDQRTILHDGRNSNPDWVYCLRAENYTHFEKRVNRNRSAFDNDSVNS